MRITKQIADQVALKLLLPKSKEIEQAAKSLADYVRDFYDKSVPDKVKKLFDEYPEYFRTSNVITIRGGGLYYNIVIEKNIIRIASSYCDISEPDKEINTLINKEIDLKKEYALLKDQIITALLNLKTYSRVISEFPEAAKHLPEKTITTVAVNLTSIREKL